MASQYYHIACLLWLIYQVPFSIAIERTNITSRFYCQAERKYIDDLKICNFIEDCLNGQDESQCGACQWTPDELSTDVTICGLRVLYSAALEVHCGQLAMDTEKELANIHSGKPVNSLLVSPSSDVVALIKHHKYLDVSGDNLLAKVHQINIEFPRLRPTDREDCELTVSLFPGKVPNLPLIGNISDRLLEWPRVSIYVVEPNKVELVEQSVLSQDVKWIELRVRIGQRLQGFWQPRMKFETKVYTSPMYIGPISYRNCEPKDVNALEITHKRPASSAEWDGELKAKCNQTNQFLCKLTGDCIDRELVCDFGRDCGPNDDSDEADCSDYEGRCDFEGSNQCGWISMHDSWLWADSQKPTDRAQVYMPDRPRVDHTYQLDRWGGHYMLINKEFLEELNMAQLIGPLVQLKDGHEQCWIRFWLSTQENSTKLSFPYLIAGYEHIHAAEMFKGQARDESGWRRFELLVLQKGLDRPSQFSMHIKFGNMSTDLVKFRQDGGYLALDDISFTPGCQLSYNENKVAFCPPNEYKCSAFRPETAQSYCELRDRLCPFKPDCGVNQEKEKIASDEPKLSPGEFEESVQVEPIRGAEETRFYVGRPFLMLLVLAFVVVVAATYLNKRRQRAYRRMVKSDPQQNEGLVMC